MTERHLTLVQPITDMTCPRCKTRLTDERFYGPCAQCRIDMRERAVLIGEMAKARLAANQAKQAEDDAVEIARLEEQRRSAPPKPWEKRQRQQKWRRR